MSFVIMSISACTTPEQRYAQEQRKHAELRAEVEQRQRALAGQCRNYGFEPRTTDFSQCLMQLDQVQHQAVCTLHERKFQKSRREIAHARSLRLPIFEASDFAATAICGYTSRVVYGLA
jgi:hypothetical protein